MPVLSVPGRHDVRLLLLSVQHFLPGPSFQAEPLQVVAVVSAQLCYRSVHGLSHLLWVSDHDHLCGEVRVRSSALPSDLAHQNALDGFHRLRHNCSNSGHLPDVSSDGMIAVAIV